MLDVVKTRLGALVPDLAGRIDGAAEFTALMESMVLPSGGVRAYLLPMGIEAGPGEALAGMFSQPVTRRLGVLLFTRSSDAAGKRALDRLDVFVEAILAALAGWAPGDEVGVFELARARIIPAGAGLLGYQIEFTIADQLRISA